MGAFSDRIGKKQERKISETLLAFAKPLIDALEEERGELDVEELRKALTIGVTIWNLFELEAQGRALDLPEDAQARLDAARALPGLGSFIDQMFDRRTTEFGDETSRCSDVVGRSWSKPRRASSPAKQFPYARVSCSSRTLCWRPRSTCRPHRPSVDSSFQEDRPGALFGLSGPR